MYRSFSVSFFDESQTETLVEIQKFGELARIQHQQSE